MAKIFGSPWTMLVLILAIVLVVLFGSKKLPKSQRAATDDLVALRQLQLR